MCTIDSIYITVHARYLNDICPHNNIFFLLSLARASGQSVNNGRLPGDPQCQRRNVSRFVQPNRHNTTKVQILSTLADLQSHLMSFLQLYPSLGTYCTLLWALTRPFYASCITTSDVNCTKSQTFRNKPLLKSFHHVAARCQTNCQTNCQKF